MKCRGDRDIESGVKLHEEKGKRVWVTDVIYFSLLMTKNYYLIYIFLTEFMCKNHKHNNNDSYYFFWFYPFIIRRTSIYKIQKNTFHAKFCPIPFDMLLSIIFSFLWHVIWSSIHLIFFNRGKRNMASLNSIIAAKLVYCGILAAFIALSRTQTISPYYKNLALSKATVFTIL